MVGEATRVALLLVAAVAATAAAADAFDVRGACRDGEPQGIYELRDARGSLRVLGAFSRGRRTGSFIYWTSSGDRIAHLPFDEGAISGTVALWYPGAGPGREPRQQLEAAYVKDALNGAKRSWHPDGSPRGDYFYERGALVAAKAWRANGTPLADDGARAQALRDAADEAKTYATLGAIVDGNLPACGPAPSGSRR